MCAYGYVVGDFKIYYGDTKSIPFVSKLEDVVVALKRSRLIAFAVAAPPRPLLYGVGRTRSRRCSVLMLNVDILFCVILGWTTEAEVELSSQSHVFPCLFDVGLNQLHLQFKNLIFT